MSETTGPTINPDAARAMDNSTCLLGSPASHIVRLSVCSLSALLNCVVLAAVFGSSHQAKGFSLLVAIDVFMNLCLSTRSGMAFVVETVVHSNHSNHPHCVYLKWLTTAWKVSYLTRSLWMVAMTSARYTVVAKPLSAPIEFNYRQQTILLCGLTTFSTAFTVAMDVITMLSSFVYAYDVTISIEVILSTGVPIVVVMILTCIMTKRLIRRRRLWTDLPANIDSNLKATKTLLLVSGSFFVLSFPHLFYELGYTIASVFGLMSSRMPTWLDLLGEIKSLLISVDSGLNFAIYFVMCRNFRIQLLGFLHIRISCLQPKTNSQTVSCGLRCATEHRHSAATIRRKQQQSSPVKEMQRLCDERRATSDVFATSGCLDDTCTSAMLPRNSLSVNQQTQCDSGYV